MKPWLNPPGMLPEEPGGSPAQNFAQWNLTFLLGYQLHEVKGFVSCIHSYVLSMVPASEYVINIDLK